MSQRRRQSGRKGIRKFEGRYYALFGSYVFKEDAMRYARQVRARGDLARVVHRKYASYPWRVYVFQLS